MGLTLRGGYDVDAALLSRFSFGASIALQDLGIPGRDHFPGRNRSLRLDMGSSQGSDLFGRTYRGTINYYDNAPESFELLAPLAEIPDAAQSIRLEWQASLDRDLFDEVGYAYLLSRDSLQLSRRLELLSGAGDGWRTELLHPEILHGFSEKTEIDADVPISGRWFWSVIAYDRGDHLRLGKTDGRPIAGFSIPAVDVELTRLWFEHSPWLRFDDYQGELVVEVQNNDLRLPAHALLRVSDFAPKADAAIAIADLPVDELPPGKARTLRIPWRTWKAGEHLIKAQLISVDSDTSNNVIADSFPTIPRGFVTTADSIASQTVSNFAYDLPFFAEVYFDSGSHTIPTEFLHENLLLPSLRVLARRLTGYPQAVLTLQGFADPMSGEPGPQLADARAGAVRDELIRLGVPGTQIKILPGKLTKKQRLPGNSQDARWVLQERRFVQMSSTSNYKQLLFSPVSHEDLQHTRMPVPVVTSIETAVPLQLAELRFIRPGFADSVNVIQEPKQRKGVHGVRDWVLPWKKIKSTGAEGAPLQVDYELVVRDSLQRQFRTARNVFALREGRLTRQRHVVWPLKFAATDPTFDFYWEKLYQSIRTMLTEKKLHIQFIGHACAIGPEDINLRLSEQRARIFKKRFLEFVNRNHPQNYDDILKRLNTPIAFGEKLPLRVNHAYCHLHYSCSNDTPYQRKLNRRIEIVFYVMDEPKEAFGAGYNADPLRRSSE